VLRAADAPRLALLSNMTGLSPPLGLLVPPVSLTAAPEELRRAWITKRITIFGREWGKGPSRSVPSRSDLLLQDHRGKVCIGESALYRDGGLFWSDLYLHADDCKCCWPVPEGRTEPTSRSLAGGKISSGKDVAAFFEEERRSLRAERKRAGRDVLLKAAMDRFGLSRKVLLNIWSNIRRDRKGGRPKKTISEGAASSIGRK